MDKTSKIFLLLIALGLWANLLLRIPASHTVRADGPMHCRGTFKVNPWGAEQKTIGGYDLDVTCE